VARTATVARTTIQDPPETTFGLVWRDLTPPTVEAATIGCDDGTDGTSDAPADWLGGGGADKLDGGANRDILKGEDGNDDLYGRYGNDVLWGDAGGDFLDGGDDTDIDDIHAGAGSDACVAHFDDVYWGGECENFV
jgi:Ca2+-binding RTX toxin-like protein